MSPSTPRFGCRQPMASRTGLFAGVLFAGVLCALFFVNLPTYAAAQESPDLRDDGAERVTEALARALNQRVTVWQRPGGGVVHVSHCRANPHGCEARTRVFARWITEVSRARDLDPFLLAAMAMRESGLDPFARGGAGEYGLIQLHPQGVGRRVRFVQSEAFRQRCRRESGACQRDVLEIGADHLSDAIHECGSLAAALGAYNRGECGETAYARRVLEERAQLLELAKDRATPPALRSE